MGHHSIEGKSESTCDTDVKAIVDTWFNYNVTLDQFKEMLMEKGLEKAKSERCIAWIVDSSGATGAFSQEIQEYIESDVFKAFAENGIQYFVTIPPKSAITKMVVERYSAKAGPMGVQILEVPNLDEAKKWLKENT